MQQQRLTDLKKTLQRELKVQTLPNDELANGSSDTEISQSKTNSSTNHQAPTAGVNTSHQTLTPEAALISHKSTHSPVPVRKSRNAHPELEEQGPEVNIMYLKHVVLKFILSREAEVSRVDIIK